MSDNPLRDLPSVDALSATVGDAVHRRVAVALARKVIDGARADLSQGRDVDIETRMTTELHRLLGASGMAVINATGILLHTNLGRAPWSARAISRASQTAAGYSSLEIDLTSGERGRRGEYVELLVTELTGAESAVVVNNNAAAVLLALTAISAGQTVPVSRGELIEIGGAYRLPAVMETSGARLVEVGTTNRTRVGDFVTALQTHDCGAILKVHPSNFRTEGFTEEASLSELAGLARADSIPLIYDLGSGLLDSDAPWLPEWMRTEPGVRQSLLAGADLVLFSGDKLLGGPQAGIIAGSGQLVSALRSHPLARALRVDAVTLAALAATLEAHLDGPPLSLPFWAAALTSADDLMVRASALAGVVGGQAEESTGAVGGGSVPGVQIPSAAVRIKSRQDLFSALLETKRPVLGRRDRGDLVLDLRAVDADDDEAIAAAVEECR